MTIVMDRTTGRSKGYGFVTFQTMEGAFSSLQEPEKEFDVCLCPSWSCGLLSLSLSLLFSLLFVLSAVLSVLSRPLGVSSLGSRVCYPFPSFFCRAEDCSAIWQLFAITPSNQLLPAPVRLKVAAPQVVMTMWTTASCLCAVWRTMSPQTDFAACSRSTEKLKIALSLPTKTLVRSCAHQPVHWLFTPASNKQIAHASCEIVVDRPIQGLRFCHFQNKHWCRRGSRAWTERSRCMCFVCSCVCMRVCACFFSYRDVALTINNTGCHALCHTGSYRSHPLRQQPHEGRLGTAAATWIPARRHVPSNAHAPRHGLPRLQPSDGGAVLPYDGGCAIQDVGLIDRGSKQ